MSPNETDNKAESGIPPFDAPRVFVSYTHERPEHKKWVKRLATDLRTQGVDVLLDQWDLKLGEDVNLFMEKGIAQSDRVLLVCTPAYAKKANEGEGGVGYERLVVTAEIAKKIATNKFICVIRDGDPDDSRPRFAKTRLHIDFRDDSAYAIQLEDLLRDLHGIPADPKPSLGKNPFANLDEGGRLGSLGANEPVDASATLDVDETYAKAEKILLAKNLLGWKRLVRATQDEVFPSLEAWRREIEQDDFDPETWISALNDAVGRISPLLILALSAVESEIAPIKDQRGLIYDLLDPPEWNKSGLVCLINTPQALAYSYHHILGAFLLTSKHHDQAVELLSCPVTDAVSRDVSPLWKTTDVMGWPRAIDDSCTKSWQFLGKLYGSQSWLRYFWKREEIFIRFVRGYNLLGSVVELCNDIRNGVTVEQLAEGEALDVPPLFLWGGGVGSVMAAAIPDRTALESLATNCGVSAERVRRYWEPWLRRIASWHFRVHHGVVRDMPTLP